MWKSETISKWQEILGRPDFTGYEFSEAPAPETDSDNVIKCRSLCSENKCGCYGTTWGCPPGSCTDEEVQDILGRYARAIILSRRYENVDFSDTSQIPVIQKEFQNICRTLSLVAASEGIDNLPLGDGGCTYCGKCTYPEPCRYPDRRVMSISGMGIDIGDYLKKQGIEFAFEENAMTLYGLILYKG